MSAAAHLPDAAPAVTGAPPAGTPADRLDRELRRMALLHRRALRRSRRPAATTTYSDAVVRWSR